MATAVKALSGKATTSSNARPRSPMKKLGATELVRITGMSGSGKGSVLKAFEDLGYYCVDNLPLELIQRFADLARQSPEIERTALVLDIREGQTMNRLPHILKQVKKTINTQVVYLEASDESLVRRFSETRRPHPLGKTSSVSNAISTERGRLDFLRNLADVIIDTSKFNVHELRSHIIEKFQEGTNNK